MAIFSSLRNRLARSIVNAFTRNDPYFRAFHQLGGAYVPYDAESKTYLEEGFGKNPDVYAVVQQMYNKTASIPWSVKTIEDEKSAKRLKLLEKSTGYNYTPQQYLKQITLRTKAFSEEEKPFPMEKPNVTQTWKDIKALYEVFLATTGNVYFYIPSPEDGLNAGTPQHLFVLPSHLMKIKLKQGADLQMDEDPIESYMLIEGDQFAEFKAEDIIHIKLPNPFYGQSGEHLYGLSQLQAGLRNIQSSNEAIDNNINTMKNAGVFGLIHSKGQTALTDPQAKSIKERLVEVDKSKNRMSNLFATTAEVGFQQIGLTTDQLKPFDYLEFDQKTICNLLGWDDKLLNNDDGAKYDNYKLAEKRVLTKTIIPHNLYWEEAFNNKFLPRFKGYENCLLTFDYDELPEMQPDMKLLTEWLTPMLNNAVINRDDYRETTGFPRLGTPEMEAYTVNMNTISLEEALNNDFEGNIDEQEELS